MNIKTMRGWFKREKAKSVLMIFTLLIVGLNLYNASYHLFVDDLLFHTDIARDFMLLEQAVDERKPPLIGPRAGGISGFFFSPFWYYILIPVFVAVGGNPVGVGVFMFLLTVLSIGITFYVSKKLFDTTTAYLTILIYSFQIVRFARGYTQSFGSVLLSPLYFYFLYLWIKEKKLKYAFATIFSAGIIFCFQPAFGMITLFVTFLVLSYMTIKYRKPIFLSSVLTLIIPLSTYIFFELRHDFLQIRSFMHFLISGSGKVAEANFLFLIQNRAEQFMGRINLIEILHPIYNTLFFVLFLVPIYFLIRRKVKDKQKLLFWALFYFYFFVYWMATFGFKGIVWDYYHIGFIPLLAILFVSLRFILDKRLFFLIYAIVFLAIITQLYNAGGNWEKGFTGFNASSWKMNKNVAEVVINDAPARFGYYVYSPDEFGYSLKYAMNYIGKVRAHQGALCKKEPTTYLIYSQFKTDKNEYTFWKENRIRIVKSPMESRQIGSTLIEKYFLEPADLTVESDPNIVCDLHFR